MSTAIGVIAPSITVSGSPLSAIWQGALVSMRVQRALGLVGRATLRFADTGYALSATSIFTLGADVEIGIPDGGRLLHGTVTGMTLEQSEGEVPELAVVVDDIAYKLTRGNAVKTFLKSSYTDAITQVVTEAGITSYDVQRSSAVNEYLLKSGTALAFLDATTRRIGYVWWVDGASGAGTLMVKKAGTSTGTVALTLGEELLDFSLRASGLRPSMTHVTGWDRDTQQPIKAETPGTAPDGLPKLVGDYTARTGPLGAAETAASAVNPENNAEATALAGSLADDAIAASIVARGRCFVDATLKPAVTVTVAGAGPSSGSYLITEVEHSYDKRGFFTRFVAGSPRPSHLVDTLGRSEPDPGFVISGLVVGTVSNNVDDENAGRVRVKFAGVNGDIDTAWARIVSVGAGVHRGTVFTPEVGDEVLLGFEHGDARRPVVLGSLFSKKNALPSTGSGVQDNAVDFRRITSRLGHVIELADGSGANAQHILLGLGTAQHRIRLGADACEIEVAEGKPVTIKSGRAQFAINSAGDVTIEGKNITLKAEQNVNVEAHGKAAVKAAQGVEASGMQLKLAATGMASVQASGMLTLKGAQVAIN